MAQDGSVLELSASLVREYLARKGLKGTLARLDEELPRTSESISNRTALAKAVHIDKLMKKNKEQATPYRTMIEVIVKHLTTSDSSTPSHSATPTRASSRHEGGVVDSTSLDGSRIDNSLGDRSSDRRMTSSSGEQIHSQKRTPEASTRPGLQSPVGKPITLKSSHPPSHEISTTSPSFDTSRPPLRSSLLKDDSARSERKKPSRSGVERKEVKVVEVRPMDGRTAHMERIVGSGQTSSFSSGSKMKSRSRSSHMGGEIPQWHNASKNSKFGGEEVGAVSLEIMGDSTNPRVELTQARHGDKLSSRGRMFKDSESVVSGKEYNIRQVIKAPSQSTTDDLLLFEDVEDIDLGGTLNLTYPNTGGASTVTPQSLKGEPIDLATAKALRELLFGTATDRSFNNEWRRQNFEFCDVPGLRYGLVQHKGGPCGVLACIQAYLLKHLLFSSSPSSSHLDPSPSERTTALVTALTDTLWKAGQQKSATVALRDSGGPMATNNKVFPGSNYRPDGLTEKLLLFKFSSWSELSQFLSGQLSVFQDPSSSGCILFLYSLLLSRGLHNVRADMDCANTALMGAHGYCTQEIVNLILTGNAVSNVFNGTQQLDSGGKEKHLLRGPSQRSEIGLLSLFEHYGVCSVGTFLKDPVHPIWVVSSESHFTVLFYPQRQEQSQSKDFGKKFDLHYYDGLANQDEAIILTIDDRRDVGRHQPSLSHLDLEPPLELVIKTKWRNAHIDWNGIEPLL